MRLEEILKQQGMTDEQITKVLSSMKENKLYLSNEENLDVRYQKLKEQKDDADKQLKTANETLEVLKKDNKSNEELQNKVKGYETTLETMKTEAAQKELDNAVELELVKLGVHSTKAARAELDMSRIKKGDDGTIVGLSEQTAAWNTQKQWLLKTVEKRQLYIPEVGKEPTTGNLETQLKNKDFNLTQYLKQQVENTKI